jgi:hypothetical protein
MSLLKEFQTVIVDMWNDLGEVEVFTLIRNSDPVIDFYEFQIDRK